MDRALILGATFVILVAAIVAALLSVRSRRLACVGAAVMVIPGLLLIGVAAWQLAQIRQGVAYVGGDWETGDIHGLWRYCAAMAAIGAGWSLAGAWLYLRSRLRAPTSAP